jgi:predicted Fe-Mo cluster-binding NifX family protein
MRIALPVSDNRVAGHIMAPEHFLIFDVDAHGRGPVSRFQPPIDGQSAIPGWLMSHGAEVVIAQRMGQDARSLLERGGVQVVTGVPPRDPEWLVREFLAGRLADPRAVRAREN